MLPSISTNCLFTAQPRCRPRRQRGSARQPIRWFVPVATNAGFAAATCRSQSALDRPRSSDRLPPALLKTAARSMLLVISSRASAGAFCRALRSPAAAVDPVGVPARLRACSQALLRSGRAQGKAGGSVSPGTLPAADVGPCLHGTDSPSWNPGINSGGAWSGDVVLRKPMTGVALRWVCAALGQLIAELATNATISRRVRMRRSPTSFRRWSMASHSWPRRVAIFAAHRRRSCPRLRDRR